MNSYQVRVQYEDSGAWRTIFDRSAWVRNALDDACSCFERSREAMRHGSPVGVVLLTKGSGLLARTERRFVVRA